MAWVVKAWKPQPLQEAERELRRLRRAAAREMRDAAAYVLVLEDLGTELREGVRGQRRRHEPRPLPVPEKHPAAPEHGEIRAHKGRASLRDSPLSELFRATG
jgi:hypothetical protein